MKLNEKNYQPLEDRLDKLCYLADEIEDELYMREMQLNRECSGRKIFEDCYAKEEIQEC